MKQLQLQLCWAVARSDGAGKVEYIQANGQAATADNVDQLVTGKEAAEAFARMGENVWPCNVAIALSLDTSRTIKIDLLNAWDEDRQQVVEGADRWVRLLNSPTEVCWRGVDGVALRIITKGVLPEGWKVPSSRVQVQQTGFCTLRLSPMPKQPWPEFDGRHIGDRTEVLAELLGERWPQYITV